MLPAAAERNLEQDKKGVRPEFKIEARENKAKSAEAGHPVYEDVEFVVIHVLGDKLNKPKMKVTDTHRQTWPDEYKAFKAGMEVATEGMPLEHWPVLTKARVAELKAQRIRTVEELAELPEVAVRGLGLEGRTLQEKAKAYLDQANSTSKIGKLIEENDSLKQDISMLKESIAEIQGGSLAAENAELKKQIAELSKPKRRGRPRKHPLPAET